VYVVGGLCGREYLRAVERYDILSDVWVELDEAALAQPSFAMTLAPLKKRYIYSFGDGNHNTNPSTPYSQETFKRLDTKKLSLGWDQLTLPNPSLVNGCQYGVVPLGSDGEVFEFLIFGGIEAKDPYDVMGRTCVFKTNVEDFRDSKFEILGARVTAIGEENDDNCYVKESVIVTSRWKVSHL